MKLSRAVRWLVFGLVLSLIPAVLSSPSQAQFGIGISVRIGPPALPVYEMPPCPDAGYMWTPGYWAWDDDDGYYWVPGTWVEAPEAGLLWTPGYWGWNDGLYVWNAGYWGPEVGFYGGINYGFGYFGTGFGGGEWRGGQFFYNTAVMNVNTTVIRNVYVNKTVIVNNNSHVAFNGGQGGVQARPTPQQETYMHQTHTPPVAAQVQHARAASQNRELFASINHGRPAVAATAKPGEFSGKGVVAARAAGGAYKPPAMSPKEARASAPARGEAAGHPAENRPAENHPAETRSENRPATAGGARAANRPAESHPAPKEASHPAPKENNMAHPSSTRSSESHKETSPHSENTRPATKPRTEPATKASARESMPKARESAPKESAPRSEPKARESAPKPSPKPAAEPKRESAPRETAPKASASRESAPHESAPKASRPAPAPKAAKPAPAPKPAPEKKEPEHKGR